MDNSSERIIWIDVETTGIDADTEALLQVAAIVTDGDLNEIGTEQFMEVVYYSEDEAKLLYESAVPFVQNMHSETDLWSILSVDGIELEDLEEQLLEFFLANDVKPGTARLGGNSITLDRNFIAAYLPRILEFLHYRSYDMTSVGGFLELFAPEIPQFEKAKTHDALDDIRESLAEARYYRDALQAGLARPTAG